MPWLVFGGVILGYAIYVILDPLDQYGWWKK